MTDAIIEPNRQHGGRRERVRQPQPDVIFEGSDRPMFKSSRMAREIGFSEQWLSEQARKPVDPCPSYWLGCTRYFDPVEVRDYVRDEMRADKPAPKHRRRTMPPKVKRTRGVVEG